MRALERYFRVGIRIHGTCIRPHSNASLVHGISKYKAACVWWRNSLRFCLASSSKKFYSLKYQDVHITFFFFNFAHTFLDFATLFMLYATHSNYPTLQTLVPIRPSTSFSQDIFGLTPLRLPSAFLCNINSSNPILIYLVFDVLVRDQNTSVVYFL